MKISVTQEHISKGVRASYTKCPVALAIREATGITVSVGTKLFTNSDTGFKKQLVPDIVSQNVTKFDLGLEVQPFEFNLYWPEVGIQDQ